MAASQGSLPTPPPPPSPVPRDGASEDLASSQSDSSDEEFTLVTPRKRRTLTEPTNSKPKRVNSRKSPTKPATSNRFAPLQSTSTQNPDNNDDTDEGDEQTTTVPKRRAPPPIILCGKPTKHNELVTYLTKHASSGFSVKYTANNTNIYINEIAERAVIVNDMAIKKMPFYTYTATNEKTYGYVLRGLDYSPEPAELAGELRLLGVDVRQTFKMRSTARPLYLVITGNQKTLNDMNREYQFLFHTRVHWERHQNKKSMSQCHRCQKWGHATTNCYMPPVCLKCAGPHITSACKKPRDTPAKCANCGEAHPANSTSCTTYIKKMEDRAQRLERNRSKQMPSAARAQAFIAAPPPSRNVWAERASAARPAQPVVERSVPTLHLDRPTAVQAAAPNRLTHATPQILHAPATNTTQATQDSCASDINILFDEMKKLNSLVNIKSMIMALKDLNAALSSARDDVEKFMTFVNFSQDLKKYNI